MPRESLKTKDDRAKRLELARKRSGYASAEAASEANGWTVSTVKSHESGRNSYTSMAIDYARAYGVTAGWLMFGENPPEWLNERSLQPIRVDSLVESQKVPFVSYNDLLSIFYNKTDIGSIMRNKQLVDMPIDKNFSNKLLYLQLDQETNTSEISKGSYYLVDLDTQWEVGDMVVVKTPFDDIPQIMEIFRDETSNVRLKYITSYKNLPIFLDREDDGPEILGRICFIGMSR